MRSRQLRRPAARVAAALATIGAVATIIGIAVNSGNVERSPAPAAGLNQPNIVFVLTDDLSMDLLRHMPQVRAMQRSGLTFRHYFVADSLCCPSRASIFSGDFPHDTRVFGNVAPDGGFSVFHDRGEEQHTFAVALQRQGYRTAMMGKYLNGYLQGPSRMGGAQNTYVPPGWSRWDVAGWGYPEFDYRLNQNGRLHRYGHARSDYLTDVLARNGVDFVQRAAQAGKPFFLELATFAPHYPSTPAPRDSHRFRRLRAPEPPSFNVLPTHPPDWLANHRRLDGSQIARINETFRRRVRAVQAVDAMIGRIESTLRATGQAANTYLVFSSDNGYHTGEYRLMPGKLTAFDTDIHVPLVVVGPGVAPGTHSDAIAENIDLAKTFAAIAGDHSMPGDGHSLLALLDGRRAAGWRNAALIEHRGPDVPSDPADYQEPVSGNPDSYEAIRTPGFLYVRYRDRTHEYYNLRRDPFELHNVFSALGAGQRQHLHSELLALQRCHTGASCWAAMHLR